MGLKDLFSFLRKGKSTGSFTKDTSRKKGKTIRMGDHFTEDELELIADDLRFYASDALSFNEQLVNAALKLADTVEDGGEVAEDMVPHIANQVEEMTTYPPYIRERGGATPERMAVLEKLKKL